MNDKEKEIAELFEYYEETGKCKKHIWTQCRPIVTSEGEFEITSCIICNDAYVDYKGEKIKGKLNDVIEFIIDRGFEHERNEQD